MGDHPHTLEELVRIIREFVQERDWEKYNHPLNLAVSASIEAGELLELFQWKNESDVKEALKDSKFKDALASEIADVLVYVLRVADTTGINPTEAILEKMKLNRKKYPIDNWSGKAPSRVNRS